MLKNCVKLFFVGLWEWSIQKRAMADFTHTFFHLRRCKTDLNALIVADSEDHHAMLNNYCHLNKLYKNSYPCKFFYIHRQSELGWTWNSMAILCRKRSRTGHSLHEELRFYHKSRVSSYNHQTRHPHPSL